MSQHQPQRPSADAADLNAAQIVATQHEQDWAVRADGDRPRRSSSAASQRPMAPPRRSAPASPTAAQTDDIRRELRAEARRIGNISGVRAGASVTATITSSDAVYRLMEKWLPLAERRREAAKGSVSDWARWTRLIDSVTRPQGHRNTSYERLVVLAAHARELLGTLSRTEPPFVAVVDVARRIEQQITDGTYAVDALLSPGRIATELGLPQDSVHLALDDLAERGLIQKQRNCRARVQASRYSNDRTRQIADWLRELIAGGVFAPGAMLPPQQELARILVSAPHPLGKALRILDEEGTLHCRPHQRPTVTDTLEAGSKTAHIARALAVLPEPATAADLKATDIHDNARKARAWWRARLSPHPDTFGQCVDHLCAAARHLVARARIAPTPLTAADRENLRSVIARTTTTAVVMHIPRQGPRIWRAACLATAVLDLLTFVERAQHRADGTPDPLTLGAATSLDNSDHTAQHLHSCV